MRILVEFETTLSCEELERALTLACTGHGLSSNAMLEEAVHSFTVYGEAIGDPVRGNAREAGFVPFHNAYKPERWVSPTGKESLRPRERDDTPRDVGYTKS